MLAAVYHGALDLRLEQVAVPEAGAGEILVRVQGASICGTDMRIYHGAHRMYPGGTVRIPGHEVVLIADEGGIDATLGARLRHWGPKERFARAGVHADQAEEAEEEANHVSA